jgi:hypothetical protein
MGDFPMPGPMTAPVKAPSDKMPLWKAALGGLFDSIAQQTGGQATFIPTMLARQQEDRQNNNAMTRWQQQYDYERAHPKPVNNDSINDVRWYIGATPEEKAAYQALHPQYQTVHNADGTITVTPLGNVAASPPMRPVGKLTPIPGGGASNGPGGFHIPSGNPLVPPR